MFVKAGQDFEPARGVMQLMQRAPEKLRFVAEAMPPIEDKGGDKVDGERSGPGW